MNRFFARCRQLVRQPALRRARQLVVAVVGGSVVLFGIALLVLPGPAFLVIPLGLAILGTEFIWAKRWLKRARDLLPHKRKLKESPPAPEQQLWHQLSPVDARTGTGGGGAKANGASVTTHSLRTTR